MQRFILKYFLLKQFIIIMFYNNILVVKGNCSVFHQYSLFLTKISFDHLSFCDIFKIPIYFLYLNKIYNLFHFFIYLIR